MINQNNAFLVTKIQIEVKQLDKISQNVYVMYSGYVH